MRRIVIHLFCIFCFATSVAAQQWTNVLQLPGTIGSCGFFFNARQGLIGTGHYGFGMPAKILYTEDGGNTWHDAALPNPNIVGQVSDIYFRDRLSGWATIIENLTSESGWSGVYHSTDGGKSWKRILQSGFPVSVRETGRGVYYIEHNYNPGVYFSSDQGKTWTQIGSTLEALGIDFIDDQTGIVTTQANALDPMLMTSDGGQHWQSITTSAESWTPYADPITRSFFLASEQYRVSTPNTSAIIRMPAASGVQTAVKTYGDSGLTGGIAGSHICQSIIYAQGRPSTLSAKGMIRSTDNGGSWTFLGGPMNMNDKRFAVTGRGAVVFAFDLAGGVWRTTNGGDGSLSPSVMPLISIATPLNKTQASTCDSAYADIALAYHLCDSVRIVSYQILNDTYGELSVPSYSNNFGFFSIARPGALHVLYRPSHVQNWTAQIKLTFAQPDGYTEETTISIDLVGTGPKANALEFGQTTSADTIDFGLVSTCADATHPVTITNTGCSDMSIRSLQVTGTGYSLASSFQPFILGANESRTFLLRYTPLASVLNIGALTITHSSGTSSLVLAGRGYSPTAKIGIHVNDSIVAALCDSMQFSITIQDQSCKPFQVFTVETRDAADHQKTTYHPIPWSSDSVHPGDSRTLPIMFIPKQVGPDTVIVEFSLAWEGIGQKDTTITLIGYGIGGTADLTVNAGDTKHDTVSLCGELFDTVYLHSQGCSGITIDSAYFDQAQNFSFVRAPLNVVPQNSSDTVVFHFKPTAGQGGTYQTNLHLNTSAGPKQASLMVIVTNDAGNVALSTSSNIHSYTCQTTPFSFTINNSTCGDISVEKVVTSGSDFTLGTLQQQTIPTGTQQIITGVFAPQDSDIRTATVTLTIKYSDGSARDTSIQISGEGIGVPPIEVALPNQTFTAQQGKIVTIPIYVTRGSTTNAKSCDIAVKLNTDLLSPFGLTGNGFFGNLALQVSPIAHTDSITIHFDLPSETIIPAGKLTEVQFVTYVTKFLSTPISLGHVTFNDATGSTQCLSVQAVSDSVTGFVLDQECGDSTISKYFRDNAIVIDRVTPNPTTGHVTLFCRTAGYDNDAMIEVYDPLGQKLQQTPLILNDHGGEEQTFDLELTPNNEGVRYLRIRTPNGAAMAAVTYKVIVRK